MSDLSFDEIYIGQNPELSECAINSICNHLISLKSYNIDNNGPGCETREDILDNCEGYIACTIESPDIFSNFDDWNENNLPQEWIGVVDTMAIYDIMTYMDTLATNISISSSISGSQGSSLNLTNINNMYSVLLAGEIELQTIAKSSFVDITFDYCLVSGSDWIGIGSLLINGTEYWHTGIMGKTSNSCSSPKLAQICNVPVTNGDSLFVVLRNKKIHCQDYCMRGSSWIIDDFKLSYSNVNSINNPIVKNDILELFPNPVQTTLNLKTDIDYDRIKIFNLYHEELMDIPFSSELDVTNLIPGVYFITMIKSNRLRTLKFVKS